jgi:hypothetical protein
MSPNEFRLAAIALFGTFTLLWGVGYLILAWIKTRAQRGLPAESTSALHEQIAHLQMSVDTMALEIERISEAQRFTTKLLADRPEVARIERGGGAR